MPWHLAYTLLGRVPPKSSSKLFKSYPLGHILECLGVASVVPITVEKIEVKLDFHIFDILDSDLLIGYPLEKLHHAPLGSIYENLKKMTSATPFLENPLAKTFPKQNLLEKMMHVSPFVSSEPVLFEVAESSTPKAYNSGETFHPVKASDPHHPRSSLSLFALASIMLFSNMIRIQP
jgi:hypothetical protein